MTAGVKHGALNGALTAVLTGNRLVPNSTSFQNVSFELELLRQFGFKP